MQLAYIRRGRQLLPAVVVGNGLLKRIPINGDEMVAAARKAQFDELLNAFAASAPKPVQRVYASSEDPAPSAAVRQTIAAHRGGDSPLISGGNGESQDYKLRFGVFKFQVTSRDAQSSTWAYREQIEEQSRRHRHHDCWKDHRPRQHRRAQVDCYHSA